MKILHTSDWHLGKTLEGFSRLEEQEQFLNELVDIVETHAIDLVLIAGDIYDSANPPAPAETLFYQTLKRLAQDQRAILVIAGNHDNPQRLMAASPLAHEHGVILMGMPKTIAATGNYSGFEVTEADEGYLKMKIRDEEAVVICLPYPSEKRLNEMLPGQEDEARAKKAYSDRVGEIFQVLSDHYTSNTINLAVSHIYVNGGLESDSERRIQLGGGLAVDAAVLPPAQYVALGHLHRPQRVNGAAVPAYYSGSPLQYSQSEVGYSKAVYIITVQPGQEANIEEVFLRNYKPIEVWDCDSIASAIDRCRQEESASSWVYINIKTDRVLTQTEIKEMKSLREDIVQIRPVFIESENVSAMAAGDYRSINIADLFREFYRCQKQGAEAPSEIMNLFYKVLEGGETEGEAAATED